MTQQDNELTSVQSMRLRHQLFDARALQVIAVPCGLGAGDARTRHGPDVLIRSGLVEVLGRRGWTVRLRRVAVGAGRTPAKNRQLATAVTKLARLTSAAVSNGSPFLVLGGDHAIAMGTWPGVARSLRPHGPLGLVWIDAHMDAHTPATTPSGNWHGMPVAHLLGLGLGALTQLAGSRPALRPEHLCIVGVRSYEPQEAALLRRCGVRVINRAEIVRIGLDAAIAIALATARRGTAGFGISLDLDVVEPTEAPGVGTPVVGGLRASELARALRGVGHLPGFAGLELVEYNPARDIGGRTAAVALDLACSVFQNRPSSVTLA